MKNLFLSLLLIIVVAFQGLAQDCKCATVVSQTTNWCTSSRGNEFCNRTAKSGNVYKEYKKNYQVNAPETCNDKNNLCTSSRGKKYYWRKSKNTGKWYKVY